MSQQQIDALSRAGGWGVSRYDTWLEGDCGVDEVAQTREEWIEERQEELVDIWLREHAEKLREADDQASMDYEGDAYTDMQAALADLHGVEPDKLLGSDVLTRLYRLAKAADEKRMAHLSADAELVATGEYDLMPTGPDFDLEDSA